MLLFLDSSVDQLFESWQTFKKFVSVEGRSVFCFVCVCYFFLSLHYPCQQVIRSSFVGIIHGLKVLFSQPKDFQWNEEEMRFKFDYSLKSLDKISFEWGKYKIKGRKKKNNSCSFFNSTLPISV